MTNPSLGQGADDSRLSHTQPATQTQPASRPETIALAHPKATDIINSAIDAMGGREAIDAIESIELTVTVDSRVHDAEAEVDIAWAKPGKFLITRYWSDGELTVGSDGTVGWLSDPDAEGYQLLAEDQTREVRKQASMHRILLAFEEQFENAETVSRETLDGHDVFRVRGVDAQAQEHWAFFDAESKLLVGLDRPLHTKNGYERSNIRFSDWKEFGDIRLFTTLNISQRDDDTVMTITDIQLNAVDEDAFELPDEIHALLKPAETPASQPAMQPQSQPATAPDSSSEEGQDNSEGGGKH